MLLCESMRITPDMEQSVRILLANGKTYKEISAEVGISEGAIAKIKQVTDQLAMTGFKKAPEGLNSPELDVLERQQLSLDQAVLLAKMFVRAMSDYRKNPSDRNYERMHAFKMALKGAL